MKNKRNPAGRSDGSSGAQDFVNSHRNSRLSLKRKKAEKSVTPRWHDCWICCDADGVEHRFDKEPGTPRTLRIRVSSDGTERAHVYRHTRDKLRPPGEGWREIDYDPEGDEEGYDYRCFERHPGREDEL